MNPLDRRLRSRRRLVTRLLGMSLLLLIGSAGVLGPRIRDHHAARGAVDERLERVERILALGNKARQFAGECRPRLEAAEAEILRLAPLEPLEAGFRSRLKARLEQLGVTVETMTAGEPEALPDPRAQEQGLGAEAVLATFVATPVTLRGHAPFESLPAVVRGVLRGARPGLIQSLEVKRSEELFPRVAFTLEIAYLHSLPEPEPPAFAAEDTEWDAGEGSGE